MLFNYPKVVENAKARREAKGYTITDLSRAAGVTIPTIRRAEEGKPVRSNTHRWIEEALNG